MSNILYESNPAMFRSRPLWFVVSVILCLVGIGFLILLVWWIQTKGKKIIILSDKTVLREGILSKSVDEVFHTDVRNIRIQQSVFQRLFGVGGLYISSAGQSNEEIGIDGIPDPQKAKDLINSRRSGKNSAASEPLMTTESVADEILKLSVLRDRGIITKGEFDAQRKKLLG